MRILTTLICATAVMTATPAAFAYRVSAWIPPWNTDALTSLQTNVGTLDEANPVWYSLAADGSIVKNWNAENGTWRAAMTGSTLVPTIQNYIGNRFDGAAVGALVASPAMRDAHAVALTALAVTNAYDGIDVDYEQIPAASRDDFTAFVAALAQRLHAVGKTLSVTVEAKTSERQNWTGPGGEDWAAIGRVADSVKIMAYDYSWSGSPPGPISPLDWLDQVTAYAERTIPAARIMVGLPWYGHDWNSSGPTTSVSYASAIEIAQANGASIDRDGNGEPTFRYGTHTVFFQDATSFARKVAMLQDRHPGIGGVAAWCAGMEDPQIWNAIRGDASIPSMTPPAADFTISGPERLAVVQGSRTVASFTLTPINGFSGTATVTVDPAAGFSGSVTVDAGTVNAGGSVRLIAAANRSALPGNYVLKIRFVSGALVHAQSVTVTVQPSSRRRAA